MTVKCIYASMHSNLVGDIIHPLTGMLRKNHGTTRVACALCCSATSWIHALVVTFCRSDSLVGIQLFFVLELSYWYCRSSSDDLPRSRRDDLNSI